MEVIYGLVGCVAVVLFLALPVVALAFATSARGELSSLRAQLEALQLKVVHLRAELDTWKARPAPVSEPVTPVAQPPVAEVPPVAALVPPPAEPEAAPAPVPEPIPEPPAPPPIEWEKWLGVRGAAVLGGVVFALAGVLFFKYSVEQGWIAPPVRVGIAVLTGLAALLLGEKLRKGYATSSNALSGGGVVVLYAATWAARGLYQLIPMQLAFGLMALITGVACLLALRHESQVVALLGLCGGFATPLLLSTGENRPIGFFGYLLLLDAGFLWVAWKRQWQRVANAALLGTLVLQGAWMAWKMEPDQLPLALGVLALFTALFVGMTRALPGEATPEARRNAVLTHAVALVFPFAFAAYLAASADNLPAQLLPLAGFLSLMGAAAAWLSRRSESLPPAVPLGAATGQVAVMFIVLGKMSCDAPADTWRMVAALLVSTLPWAAALEWPRGEEVPRRLLFASAASLAGLGLIGARALLLHPLPATFGAAVLFTGVFVALALRRSARAGESVRQSVPAVGGAAVLGLFTVQAFDGWQMEESWPALSLPLGALAQLGLVALFAGAGWLRSTPAAREGAFRAGARAAATLLALFMLAPSNLFVDPREPQLGAVLLMAAGAACATFARSGRWVLGVSLLSVLAQAHTFDGSSTFRLQQAALLVASTLLATSWPLLAGPSLLTQRAAAWTATLPWVATLALLPWPALKEALGLQQAPGLFPLAFAAVLLGQLAWALRAAPEGEPRKRMVVWLAGLALMLVSVAIPVQLERQWMTLGWALMAVALLLLWQRLDHEGLKYFAAGLLLLVTVRLVFNPYVLDYGERGARIFNWLMYTYLVPAACLALSARLLAPLEVPRLRDWERRFYPAQAALAALSAVGFMVVVFAYLTLAVFDFYAPGGTLSLSLDRLPARDLTLSLVWLLYAAAILAVGMWKAVRALRWASLVVMLLSIAKVFLYDLGNLKDLYRVLSLLGLAVSLLLVSLAYQRFVFRKEPT